MISASLNRIALPISLACAPWSPAAAAGTPPLCASQQDESGMRAALADVPLEGWQQELIEIAFASASALPMVPHVKDRSRAQEQVVLTCLALDLPRRALDQVAEIKNWRKGAAWAALAEHCVARELEVDVRPFLDLALEVATRYEDASDQEWRRDRIRAAIARVHLLLGQDEAARPYLEELDPKEARGVAALRAELSDADRYEPQVQAAEAVFAAGGFEPGRAALASCAALYRRFYPDTERRARLEALMERGWEKLPFDIRIDGMIELADVALVHDDAAGALAWLGKAQDAFDSVAWQPRHGIPLRARLAAARWRAGEHRAARARADELLAEYASRSGQILDFDRGETLRPLAEAYQAMGESDLALTVYRRAVDEGALNPNARPRANDLVATCCSMLRSGLAPDPELLERVRAIRAGLADPW